MFNTPYLFQTKLSFIPNQWNSLFSYKETLNNSLFVNSSCESIAKQTCSKWRLKPIIHVILHWAHSNSSSKLYMIHIYSTKLLIITIPIKSLKKKAKCSLQKWMKLRWAKNWNDLFKMSQKHNKSICGLCHCLYAGSNQKLSLTLNFTIHLQTMQFIRSVNYMLQLLQLSSWEPACSLRIHSRSCGIYVHVRALAPY